MVAWLRTLFRTSTNPADLPLSARIATLEGELLHVHAQLDTMHGSLKKLSGKIYRGVSLGDTVEAAKPPVEDGGPFPDPLTKIDVFEKAALYRAAAQLRGR